MTVTFTEKVLAVVRRIPKGEVRTYQQVAQRAGNAKAARVVGSIMRKNFNNSVPCHRVIRANGRMGNYNRGGGGVKRALLKKEKAI